MDGIIEIVAIVAIIWGIGYVFQLRSVAAARIPRAVRIRTTELPAAPWPFGDLFEAAEGELAALGFEQLTWARFDIEPEDIVSISLCRIYRHAEAPILARVVAPHNVAVPNTCVVHFFSEAADGRLLWTGNRQPEIFEPQEDLGLTRNQAFESLEAQYQAHRSFIADHQPVPPGGAESVVDRLNRYENESLQRLQASDRFQPHRGGLAPKLRYAPAMLKRLKTSMGKPRVEQQPVPGDRAWVLYKNFLQNATEQPPMRSQLELFALSSALFALAGGLLWGFEFTAILFAVIAFHEAGHYLAMRWLGYRSLQVLMLPLVGGVAFGQEAHPSATGRALVALMGPLPGIVVGIAIFIGVAAGALEAPLWSLLAMVMLFVNYLNLLPILPLDGGHVLRALIPERWVHVLIAFEILAVPALIWIGWQFGSLVFGLIALVPLFSVIGLHREHKIIKRLRDRWQADLAESEYRAVTDCFEQVAEQGGPMLFPQQAEKVRQLMERLKRRPPPALAVVTVLAVYLGLFAVPVIGGLTAMGGLLPLFLGDDSAYLEARDAALEKGRGQPLPSLLVSFAPDGRRAPADTVEIEALELRLDRAIPGDYRGFLGQSNGWGNPWSDGEDWILPAHRVMGLADANLGFQERLAALRQLQDEMADGFDYTEVFIYAPGDLYAESGSVQLATLGALPVLAADEISWVLLEDDQSILAVSETEALRYGSFSEWILFQYAEHEALAALETD